MEKEKKVLLFLLFLLFIAIVGIAFLIFSLVTNDNNCTSIINLKNKQISDKDATISDKDATIILQKTQISSKSNVLVGTDTLKKVENNLSNKVIFNLPSYFGANTIDCLVIVSYKNETTGNVLSNVVRAYYYPGNQAGVAQVFNMTTQTTIPFIEVTGDYGVGNVYARVLNGDNNSTYKISWTVIRL